VALKRLGTRGGRRSVFFDDVLAIVETVKRFAPDVVFQSQPSPSIPIGANEPNIPAITGADENSL